MIDRLKEATKYALINDAQLLLIPQGVEVVLSRELNSQEKVYRKIITWEGISDSMLNIIILAIDNALDDFKELESKEK